MNLQETLEVCAEATELPESDHAAMQLARIYAMQIDIAVIKRDTRAIADFGPKLLATLTALGMTQAGRAAKEIIKGGAANDSTDPAAATFAKLRTQFN